MGNTAQSPHSSHPCTRTGASSGRGCSASAHLSTDFHKLGRPVAAHPNEDRRTVTLYFSGGIQGEFIIRGGVCWPTAFVAGGKSDFLGYAILAGFELYPSGGVL